MSLPILLEGPVGEAVEQCSGEPRVDAGRVPAKAFGAIEDFDADGLTGGRMDADVDPRLHLDVLGRLRLAEPREEKIHLRLVVALEADRLLGCVGHLGRIMRWADPAIKAAGRHARV